MYEGCKQASSTTLKQKLIQRTNELLFHDKIYTLNTWREKELLLRNNFSWDGSLLCISLHNNKDFKGGILGLHNDFAQ